MQNTDALPLTAEQIKTIAMMGPSPLGKVELADLCDMALQAISERVRAERLTVERDAAVRELAAIKAGIPLAWSIAKERRDSFVCMERDAARAEQDLLTLESAGFAKHLPTLEDVRAAWGASYADAAIDSALAAGKEGESNG